MRRIRSLTNVSTQGLIQRGLVNRHVRVGEHTLAPGAELEIRGTPLELVDAERWRAQGALELLPVEPHARVPAAVTTADTPSDVANTLPTGAPSEPPASVDIPSLPLPPLDISPSEVLPYAAARPTFGPTEGSIRDVLRTEAELDRTLEELEGGTDAPEENEHAEEEVDADAAPLTEGAHQPRRGKKKRGR